MHSVNSGQPYFNVFFLVAWKALMACHDCEVYPSFQSSNYNLWLMFITMTIQYLLLQSTCIGWVVPLFDSSHHQEFYICHRGSQPKPFLATILLGKGDNLWDHGLQHQGDNLPHHWATLKGMHHVGTRDFQVSMAWGRWMEMAGYWWDVCPAVNVGRARCTTQHTQVVTLFFNRTSFSSLGFSRIFKGC